MKKNISINISGIIFHIEEDGYETLQRYLDSINNYFSSYEESEEIIADIESRIAEIFLERLTDGNQVVSAADVADLMKTMGNTSDFEAIEEETDFASTQKEHTSSTTSGAKSHSEQTSSNQRQQSTYKSTGPKRLFRDLNNQILGGVGSGLAHYFDIDAIWIRVAFILLLPVGGLSLITYFILWVVVPGSHDLEENTAIKKLYRDPDDRVLGGVCSGLAKFLNIDGIVVRIIFIVLFFGAGTGLIAYLILWAITPEANSITDKMQMKGERVTLSNIDENIKKQKTEEDFGPKDEGAFTKVLLFPFRLIGKMLTGISKALAPLMLFIVAVIRIFTGGIISIVGLSTMFAILVTAGVIFGLYSGEDWYYIDGDLSYIPYEVMNDTVPLAGLIALLIVVFIPFLYVFIAGITVIAKRKIMSSSVGWSILGVWLIAILVSTATLPNVVRDFREESSITYSENIEVNGGTIILDVDDRYRYRRNNDFYVLDLDIRASKDNQLTLESRVRSRGRDRRDAEDNAKMINYDYRVQDSTITFDNVYDFGSNGKFRAQELDMTLYIPEGQPFRIKRGMEDLLGYFGRGYRWSEVYRNTWIYSERGLECMTCDERRSNRGQASIDRSGSRDYQKTIDLADVNAIYVRESFDVYVQQGSEEKVVIESTVRNVDDVSADTSSGEVTLRAFGINDDEANDIRVYITLSSLEKLTLQDKATAEIKGFDERTIEINLRNEARAEFDGKAESLDISIRDNGRMTVFGQVDKLKADLRNDARLYATEVDIQAATLTTNSESRARLKVEDYLTVDARGRSSVRYNGSPELDVINKSSSASVGAY